MIRSLLILFGLVPGYGLASIDTSFRLLAVDDSSFWINYVVLTLVLLAVCCGLWFFKRHFKRERSLSLFKKLQDDDIQIQSSVSLKPNVFLHLVLIKMQPFVVCVSSQSLVIQPLKTLSD